MSGQGGPHLLKIGPSRLIVGEAVSTLALLPDDSVDLTVTSPPYDDLRRYDTPAPLDLTDLGRQLLRVTKPGGVCAVVIGDASHRYAKSLSSFRLALTWCDHIGWRLFETCLYQRQGRPGPWWRTRFRVDHEYIHLFFKPSGSQGERPKTFHKDRLFIPTKHAGEKASRAPRWRKVLKDRDMKDRDMPPQTVQPLQCRGTVWPYAASSAEGNRRKSRHPATMPDKLATDLIRCFSDPGGLVLDPLMGSGTTCVMAARLGRLYFGVDVSPAYCQLAEERLQKETWNKEAWNAVASADADVASVLAVPQLAAITNSGWKQGEERDGQGPHGRRSSLEAR